MAILKCKMCGGDILLSEDKTFGTCEYCGSTMTFPKVSDEQRLNLFNRANHYRRMNDFDKAISTYERILEQDDSDAEAHFGAVLSRFGIEYVEDPASHERIPTCHRVQAASILTDEDYLAALEHAPDAASREIYEREGKRIAGIQKDILAISAQEKPYDVFICYKETGEDGQRTKDSTLAQEIYYELTNAGYKVFFSRITLEDKLGTQYEPYIFAALNSAKVMLVIGTRPEHFNAVWVKNEWSRYLALMKTDRKRLLIPCYRDMDAYELPEELSGLQSQDMSRIGFIQDIIRGVKKVLDADKAPSAPAQQTGAVPQAVAPGVESLLKRARLFLENGEWDRADEYAEKVLDIDPESALAYMVKVCAAERVHKEADLAGCKAPIFPRTDFQNALRFAAPGQKAIYEGYNQAILDRLENERKTAAYEKAQAMQKAASTEGEYLNAAKAYQAVSGFRDALEKAEECRRQAAQAKAEAERIAEERRQRTERERLENAYADAERAEKSAASEADYLKAAEKYEAIPGYQDADERAKQCRQQAQIKQREAIQQKKRNTRLAILFSALAVLVIAGMLLYTNVLKPMSIYKAAEDARTAGKYEEARAGFESLGEYKDATEQILATYYAEGLAQKSAKQWDSARTAFKSAGSYSDSTTQILATYYAEGEALRSAQKWEDARAAFKSAGSYSDASTQILATYYAEGEALRSTKQWESARAAFTSAGTYSDATTQILATYYAEGQARYALAQWEEAKVAFLQAGSYGDAEDQVTAILDMYYQQGVAQLKAGDYTGALTAFKSAGSYSDAATQILATYYEQGKTLKQAKDYAGAVTAFKSAGSYSDATTQILATYYEQGKALRQAKDYAGAVTAFKSAGSYSDAATQILATYYEQGKALRQVKDYAGAIAAFESAGSYSDAATQAESLSWYVAGSIVTFGSYEQDNNKGDGTEPIEWIVLATDGKTATLISRYALDSQKYNYEEKSVTWETCTLRTWLNGTFLQTAFSAEEQKRLQTVTVTADKNPSYSTDPGNATQDRVWLLSIVEAEKYFSTKSERVCKATAYAKAQGAYTNSSGACWWWLRSPGYGSRSAAHVYDFGSFDNYGRLVYFSDGAVRPVVVVGLSD